MLKRSGNFRKKAVPSRLLALLSLIFCVDKGTALALMATQGIQRERHLRSFWLYFALFCAPFAPAPSFSILPEYSQTDDEHLCA
jgi:hypothetical protein